MSGTLAAVTALAVGAIFAGRRTLVRSTFDLAADFAQAEATGARRDFVQQLTRVDRAITRDQAEVLKRALSSTVTSIVNRMVALPGNCAFSSPALLSRRNIGGPED